jgi:hypothetical protein
MRDLLRWLDQALFHDCRNRAFARELVAVAAEWELWIAAAEAEANRMAVAKPQNP